MNIREWIDRATWWQNLPALIGGTVLFVIFLLLCAAAGCAGVFLR